MEMELINQIFEVCLIPLLGILTAYFVRFVSAKLDDISAKRENDLEKKYINMLDDTITKCTIATTQTYVDALKKQGSFDAEAQKVAF